jgi:YD repeat-containing protein
MCMLRSIAGLLLLLTLSGTTLYAQRDPNIESSAVPYGSYDSSTLDRIDLHNGSLTLHIPIFDYPQRGDIKTSVVLMLGSKPWHTWESSCVEPSVFGQTACKGKWHIGYQSLLGVPQIARSFGVYPVIDDGMPQTANEQRFHYSSGVAPPIGDTGDIADRDPNVTNNTIIASPIGGPGFPPPVPPDPQPADSSQSPRQQWDLHYVWFPDGTKIYMGQETTSRAATVDGSYYVCLGCTADPAMDAPTTILRRDGSRTTYDSSGNTLFEDRNGNKLHPAGVDTMGRKLYQGLSGTDSTLEGCDPGETSAALYSFPAPNQGSGDSSRLLKLCSHVEVLQSAFSADASMQLSFTDSYGNPSDIAESGPIYMLVVSKAVIFDGVAWSSSPAYRFEYNNGVTGQSSAGIDNTDYGDLTKVTLPGGGTISYTWGIYTPCESGLLTPVSRAVLTRTVDPHLSDPSQVQRSTYVVGDSSSTVTDKEGNTISHTFSYLGRTGVCSPDSVETSTSWLDSHGATLKKVDTEYAIQESQPDFDSVPFVRQTAETTTTADGSTYRREFDYDTSLSLIGSSYIQSGLSHNLLLHERVFAGGQGHGGTVLRCTSTEYLESTGSSQYLALDELDDVSSEQIFGGDCSGGTLGSQTNYGYDETAVEPVDSVVLTSGTLDPNPPTGSTRGNRTSTTRMAFAAGLAPSDVVETESVLQSGQTASSTDPRGYTTYYEYDALYLGAYRTSTILPVTNSVNHIVNASYDYNTGKIVSFTGENGQTSSFSYDALARIWYAQYPDAALVSSLSKVFCYPSLNSIAETVAMDGNLSVQNNSQQCIPSSANSITTSSKFDGLGRVIQTSKPDGLGSVVTSETRYDDLGRVYTVANYHSGPSSSTDGVITNYYDGLDRPVAIVRQDGSTSTTCYDGVGAATYTNCPSVRAIPGLSSVATTDEAMNTWVHYSDALAHLTYITEPTGLNTGYRYDALGNLTLVNQLGNGSYPARNRSFAYDSLSQLLLSNNPETGVICYGHGDGTVGGCEADGYDPNGNLLTKTDARGITTTYQYDPLNRLLQRSFTDGTRTEFYRYDGQGFNFEALPAPWGTNAIGRLSHTSNAVNVASIYAYDVMGRLIQKEDCLPSDCSYQDTQYALYDLAGNLTDLTYPDGHHVKQTYDAAGRLNTSDLVDIRGALAATSYLQPGLYYPDGSPSTITLGNGVQQTVTKNSRLQFTGLMNADPLTSQTFLSKTYCYANCATGGTANNGNIWGIVDTLNPARTKGYTYDSLNRLSSFSLGGAINQQYAIDSFGNMSFMAGTKPVTTFDPATNRINNLPCAANIPGYDAAGNQLCASDQYGAVFQNAYDAENRIVSMNTLGSPASPFVTYAYDADGQRVMKAKADGSWTDYVYFNGQPVAELASDGISAPSWTDYIYANGEKIARIPGTDTRYHLTGNDPATDGSLWVAGLIPVPANFTVHPDDVLSYRLYSHNANAGINLAFADGSNTDWYLNGANHQSVPADTWTNISYTLGGLMVDKQLTQFQAGTTTVRRASST